jgi:hypothetical protein
MYSVKVWATSVLIGPIVLLFVAPLLAYRANGSFFKIEDIELFIVIILMGAICSLPSFAVFYFISKVIINYFHNPLYSRLLLTVIGVLVIYLPFFLIDDGSFLLNIDILSRPMFTSYSIVLIASIWLYKLKQNNLSETITNQY